MFYKVFLLLIIVSFLITGLVRSYTLRKGILDIPNQRSSHVVATPRGGGLGIVVVLLSGPALMYFLGIDIPSNLAIALIGGGTVVAIVGWLDDKKNLSIGCRITFHILAAIWAIYWLGGLPYLNLGFYIVPLSYFGFVAAVITIVWMTNLYNFMDGIDGLAGSEAMIVAVMAGLVSAFFDKTGIAAACGVLAAAAVGFLIWNWPPAKIFMGDAGSGFLGFAFAVLAIASENQGGMPLLLWMLLLGVFIIDATATLTSRILRGDVWYQAHRTHAYQLVLQAGFTHKQVTMAIILINIGLCLVSWLAVIWSKWLLLILVIAYVTLYVIWTKVQQKYRVSNDKD